VSSVTTRGTTARDRVVGVFSKLKVAARPDAWISLRSLEECLEDADEVDRRTDDGVSLPLAGLVFAVKDNIDVAGLPTTAACEPFRYQPSSSETCVQRLVDAGAIPLGKTNMDQFATGLVGTASRARSGQMRERRSVGEGPVMTASGRCASATVRAKTLTQS
jgi:allophanate hydrolase